MTLAEMAAGRLTIVWRPASPRGMTLVECMVALFILSIGLLGVMAVIPQASQNTLTGSTLSTATFLATEQLEQIKHVATPAYPYGSAWSGGVAYLPGARVSLAGVPYVAIAANTGSAPPSAPWVLGPGYLGTYGGLVGCTGITSDPIPTGTTTETPAGYPDYSRTTVISTALDVCPMKTVSVTTSYRGNPLVTLTLAVSPR